MVQRARCGALAFRSLTPEALAYLRSHLSGDKVELEISENHADGLKVLIVSFSCLFTYRALELLKARNIIHVEIGRVIRRDDFSRSRSKTREERYSKVFHELKVSWQGSTPSGLVQSN